MGQQTDIGFCDSTSNVEVGCNGCELWCASTKSCYAGTLTARHAGRPGWPESFDKPKLFLHRLDTALRWPDLRGQARPEKPWLNGLPRVIFLNDMGDSFTESLPVDWLAPVWRQIANSRHIFLLLTKRPHRMREFLAQYGCPPNVWPGTSITSMANIVRLDELAKIASSHRWVSAEPLLSALDASRLDPTDVRWLVVGGESGNGARPSNLQWFRKLRDHCLATGIAFFMKQAGSAFGAKKGTGADAIPEDLFIRQVPGAGTTPLVPPPAPRKSPSVADQPSGGNSETISPFPTLEKLRRMTVEQKSKCAQELLTSHSDKQALDAIAPVFQSARNFSEVFEIYRPVILVLRAHFARPGRPKRGRVSWKRVCENCFGVSLRRMQQLLSSSSAEPKRRKPKKQHDRNAKLKLIGRRLAQAVLAGNEVVQNNSRRCGRINDVTGTFPVKATAA